MRRVYLIRHGEADPGPGRKHICLGRLDVPLSQYGEEQSGRLGQFFRGKNLRGIYTSPLTRCRQTVQILTEASGHADVPVRVLEGFAEVDTGEWDGLTFEEIRVKYSEIYAARGEHPATCVIPGGESFAQAGERFLQAFLHMLSETSSGKTTEISSDKSAETSSGKSAEISSGKFSEVITECEENEEDRGDLLVCAHAGVIRAFLCLVTGTDMDRLMDYSVPTASVTILEVGDAHDNDNPDFLKRNLKVQAVAFRPSEYTLEAFPY